jgi:hypothetical protein
MAHFLVLPLAVSLMAATASPVRVETAHGDWSDLPRLDQGPYDHLNSVMMAKLYEITSERRCRLPGFVANRLDFGVSFAAQFDRDGTVRRIIIPDYGCPEAEAVIGGALLEMIRGRDYRPTGKNPNGWYRGSFSFGFAGMDPISY